MKRCLLLSVVALSFATLSCAMTGTADPGRPQAPRADYPVVVEGSVPKRRRSENSWRRLLEINSIPPVNIEFEPALLVPRALPSEVSQKIPISAKAAALSADSAREALRQFIAANMRLLAGEGTDRELSLTDLSLINFAEDSGFFRATYRQMNFPIAIAKGYGELRITVSRQGTLLQLSSKLLPPVDIPTVPIADGRKLADGLVGRVFSYSGIDGRPLQYKVAAASEMSVKDLVIYPKESGERLLLYLAFPVEAGRGMTWTVFFDAITGQEIDVKQNFNT